MAYFYPGIQPISWLLNARACHNDYTRTLKLVD